MNIKLRKWEDSDLVSLIKHANNFNVAKNLTNQFPHPYTEKDGIAYLSLIASDEPVKVFAITLNNEAIGSIGIFPQGDIHCKNAEMGYWLSEEYWGKGIMVKAVKEIVEYGFNTFNINRIFARPFGTNKASQRVLEKSGFTLEAKFEKVIYKNGEFLDEIVYAIRK